MKSIFKEKRLIFDVTAPKGGDVPQVSPQPTVTVAPGVPDATAAAGVAGVPEMPVSPADVAVLTAAAEGLSGGTAERKKEVFDKTKVKFENLKSSLDTTVFSDFMRPWSGKVFDGKLNAAALPDDLTTLLPPTEITTKVAAVLGGMEVDIERMKLIVGTIFDVQNMDPVAFKDALQTIMTAWVTDELKKKLLAEYQFVKEFSGMPEGSGAELIYSLTVNPQGLLVPQITFSDEAKYRPFYKVLWDKRIKEQPTAPSDPATMQMEADKIKEMQENPIVGPLLTALGFGAEDPKTNETGFQAIARNKHPILAFLLGIFGLKAFAREKASVEKLAGMSDTTSKLFAGFMDKVKELTGKYVTESGAQAEGVSKEAVSVEKISVQNLLGKASEKEPLDKDFKLSENYEINTGELGVKIELASGGNVVIPEKEKYIAAYEQDSLTMVEDTAREGGHVFNYQPEKNIVVARKLPKGTVLPKGAKLSIITKEVVSS